MTAFAVILLLGLTFSIITINEGIDANVVLILIASFVGFTIDLILEIYKGVKSELEVKEIHNI